MSKGDKNRITDQAKFNKEFDRIFNKKGEADMNEYKEHSVETNAWNDKPREYWVSWDYDFPNVDLADLLLSEINELVKKHGISINHAYVEDEENGNNYRIELTIKKEKIKCLNTKTM